MVKDRSEPNFRSLTPEERDLLERLLGRGTENAERYLKQLPDTTVVGKCSCGCPTLDLAVRGIAASLSSPSTILADARGVSPEGVQFEIILHAREGLLSELEAYSILGESSGFTLPPIDEIEIY